jgi:hypothetical protein
MAGTLADGQLSAPADRHRTRYGLATVADDAAIRRLLRETPTRGAISLSFEREPNYFRGAHLAGAEDRTLLAYERERLVCMGRCTTRDCWLNGEIRRVAYLGELRLHASAQGRFDILRRGYEFFHTLRRNDPVDFTFTSIAADNLRARALFERGLPRLPRYTFLTEFVTLLIPTARLARKSIVPLGSATPAELVMFLNAEASRHHLGTAWSNERLAALANHDLPLENIGVYREGGRIVAAAALWDQRSFRQTVIRDYVPSLAFVRPLVNFAGRLAGWPQLPAPGTVLAHAFLSPLAVAKDRESLLPDVVAAFCQRAAKRGLEFVTLGFSIGDPRLAPVRDRFRCRAYVSRLYRVAWPDEPATVMLDHRPFLPEVAWL